jgi:hypothetical protein
LEALGDAFASAMGTGDGEDGQSFITALVDALTDVSTNIGVTVKNDGFDSMISSSNRP